MAKIKLTKSNIDDLKPGAQDVVCWDDTLGGFGLKVTPKGRKVFFVLYRTRDGAARLRKYTIGPYGTVTPAVARATARGLLGRPERPDRGSVEHRAVGCDKTTRTLGCGNGSVNLGPIRVRRIGILPVCPQ
jgi:hypothetical protein